MWQCVKCGEKLEDSFDVCWSCGTSKDGVEDPDFRKADDVPPEQISEAVAEAVERGEEPERNPIMCPRCRRKLDYVGTKAFHEGNSLGCARRSRRDVCEQGAVRRVLLPEVRACRVLRGRNWRAVPTSLTPNKPLQQKPAAIPGVHRSPLVPGLISDSQQTTVLENADSIGATRLVHITRLDREVEPKVV